MNASDVGIKTRAQASVIHLKELNQYVEVNNYEGEVNTEFLSKFDVVVFTDCYDVPSLIKFNQFCRSQEKPIGFIWNGSIGLYGWCFVDFGDSHAIFDKNGERCLSAIVTSISNEKEAMVTVNDANRHGFEDGDWVTFKEVQGMVQVNDNKYKIEVVSPFSFKLVTGDTSSFPAYTREGTVMQVKVPFPIKQRSLAEALEEPMGIGEFMMQDPDMDFENMNIPLQLHVILRGLTDYFSTHRKLPSLLNEQEAADVEKLCDIRIQEIKSQKDEFNSRMKDEKNSEEKEPTLYRVEDLPTGLAKNIALYCCAQVAPFNSFWGGIVAQEVVKYTGKFTPLNQWLHYSLYNHCLPEGEVTRTVSAKDRYRDQKAIFGDEAVEKLRNLKVFMIGAGALGCEYLKQFALMGVATNEGASLTVTDDDSIETSNLNRQFLFRNNHVGESKSEVSCRVAKTINGDLRVKAMKDRVGTENEPIFTDVFWDELDAVFGAVDNIKARQYVDSKCVFHKKILFESGTLGTKCNTQMVIPHETQCYSDSQDPEEKSIPMCTLRNYPYLLDHTIERARDVFQGFFCDGTADFGKLIKDPKGWVAEEIKQAGNQPGGVKEKFEFLNKLALCWPKRDLQGMVNVARQLYQDNFIDEINQLLHCFPADYVDDDGRPFWTAPKRAPAPLTFNSDDEMSFLFVRSIVTIMSYAMGVNIKFTDEELKTALSTSVFIENKPTERKIKKSDDDQEEDSHDKDEKYIKSLSDALSSLKPDPNFSINLVEFEKDDDSNGHIDFMAAFANLRARNYSIEEETRFKIKLTAGKIIPAIATATAMIVGACGIELYKYILGKKTSAFRNAFCNLALPNWVFSETIKPSEHKDQEMDPIMFMPTVALPPSKFLF